MPSRAARPEIHAGRRLTSTGQDCTNTPCFSKALSQALDQTSFSGRVVTTSSRLSGPGSAASAASTAAPSLPGRGAGMRISRMRRSAKSDRAWLAWRISDQSKLRSVTNRSRPAKPSARARLRTASAASPVSRVSSPAISQARARLLSSVRGSWSVLILTAQL
jgi:hypothetical protein